MIHGYRYEELMNNNSKNSLPNYTAVAAVVAWMHYSWSLVCVLKQRHALLQHYQKQEFPSRSENFVPNSEEKTHKGEKIFRKVAGRRFRQQPATSSQYSRARKQGVAQTLRCLKVFLAGNPGLQRKRRS